MEMLLAWFVVYDKDVVQLAPISSTIGDAKAPLGA